MSLFQRLGKQFFACILFVFSTVSFSQSLRNYTLANGLPGNSIKALYKDSKGIMWIATETGLCTYDGLEFEVVNHEDGLKYNLVWNIIEDKENNIWLSLYGNGIAKFDGDKFTYYNKKNGLVNDAVRTLYYSEENETLVLGTEDGLSVFDGNTFRNFSFSNSILPRKSQVNFISQYNGKILFSVSKGGIYELKIDKKEISNSTIDFFCNLNTINFSGFINGNNYYSLNSKNQFEINNLRTREKTTREKTTHIWDFAVDNSGVVYGASWGVNNTEGGLYSYSKGELKKINTQYNITSNQIWCLYYDEPSEQLWVGSVDQGIFVIDLSKKINLISADNLGLTELKINSLFIDSKGSLWMGGVNFIIKRSSKIMRVIDAESLNSKIENYLKLNHRNTTVTSDKKEFICHSIKEHPDGRIFVLTNLGLICFDSSFEIQLFTPIYSTGGYFEFISSNKVFVSPNYNKTITLDAFDFSEQKIGESDLNEISLDANKIIKDGKRIWISSYYKGLFLLENESLFSMLELGFLNEKNITEVVQVDTNKIIVGTLNGSVYMCHWINSQLAVNRVLLPEKDIVGNSIYFIREFDKFLFIGTNKGVNVIKDNVLIQFIDENEGLLKTNFKDAVIDHKNKELLAASHKGLIKINIERILNQNKLSSPIYIKEFKINGIKRKVQEKSILNHDENTLEFIFQSNNILNSSKHRYRYKIEGLSETWSEYSNNTNLKLFGLSPKKYTLHVEGKNIGSNECFKPISTTFVIKSPFWKSWWFISSFLFLITLVIIHRIRLKIRRIKEKSNIEKRLVETRLMALQAQMNPHFIFNAMNSIQNFVISKNIDFALWYIGEFSKVIRQTLEFSSIKNITLDYEIEYLRRYIELENLRRRVKVFVDFQIRTSDNIEDIEIPPLILQPLIENVFVHAFDQKKVNPELKIEFSQISNKLLCLIVDNGKGMLFSKKNSKGISLVKERLKLNNDDFPNNLTFCSSNKGTRVLLIVCGRSIKNVSDK